MASAFFLIDGQRAWAPAHLWGGAQALQLVRVLAAAGARGGVRGLQLAGRTDAPSPAPPFPGQQALSVLARLGKSRTSPCIQTGPSGKERGKRWPS